MHTLTFDQVRNRPQDLMAEARQGTPAMVVDNGQPVFMAVPMGQGMDAREVRLELALGLFDHEQVSIGVAASIAGISISEMIDELGKRQISVIRYEEGELEEEMSYVRTLADRG